MPSQHLVRASGSGGWHGRCGSVQLSIPPWPRGRAWRTKQEREEREEGVRQTPGHLLSCCPWGEKKVRRPAGTGSTLSSGPDRITPHTARLSGKREGHAGEKDSLVPHAQASGHGPGVAGKHLCNLLAFLHTSLVFRELSPLAAAVQEPCALSPSNAGEGAWPVTVGP